MAKRNWTSMLSVSAVGSALVSIACCLPLGIAGSAVAATLGAAIVPARPVLLVLSGVLLVVGFLQFERGPKCSARRKWTRAALLAGATLVVVLTLVFPEFWARVLADLF